ncbi:MAG TPA: hypothetical protein VGE52_12300 [Pirellulales bacterium]
MQIYVVSDNEAVSIRIREELVRGGRECPDNRLLPLSYGPRAVEQAEVIILVMSPRSEEALAVLRDVKTAIRASGKEKYVLAVGPADARLILRAIQLANGYLDEHELDQLDAKLDEIIPKQEFSGKIISVLAPSGGSGGSVIAVNIATQLAKERKSCVLMDLKLGAGVCDALLDVRPSYTMADLCRQSDRMDFDVFDKLMTKHTSGVDLLAPPTSFNDFGYITPEGVHQGVVLSRSKYPFIVADLDRNYSAEQVELLSEASVVLAVLRLDFTSLRNMRQALDHLQQLGIRKENIKLIVNRLGQPNEIKVSQAEEALGMKVLKSIPNDPGTCNKSCNNGIPIVLSAPRTPIGKALIELTKAVSDICNK